MTNDITKFVWGEMDWETAISLLSKVSKSEAWIDYLLLEMELRHYWEKSIFNESPDCASVPSDELQSQY